METDDAAKTNAPVVDVRFYKTFWSLQTFFQNPNVALGVAGGWDAFYAAFQAVLDNFETHRLDASDETAATTAEESALGVKYLTAAPLLQLQLRDPAFRRSFLLQCAILLGHCEGPPALPKVKRDQVAKAKARVMAATAATPPNARGVEFAEFVAAALKREVYWVGWKKDNCKDFQRASEPRPPPKPPPPVMRKRPRLGTKQPAVPPEKRVKLGNPELDRLWNLSVDNASSLREKKAEETSMATFLQPVLDDMDPEAQIEEAYKQKNDKVFVWKALRMIAKENLTAFSKLGTDDMEAVVPGLLGVEPPGGGGEKSEPEPEPEPKPEPEPTGGGEEEEEEGKAEDAAKTESGEKGGKPRDGDGDGDGDGDAAAAVAKAVEALEAKVAADAAARSDEGNVDDASMEQEAEDLPE